MQSFQPIADRLLDGMVLLRSDMTISYANAAFCAMSGWDTDTCIDSPFDQLFPDTSPSGDHHALNQLHTEDRWTGVWHLQRPDGVVWVAQVTSVAVPDATTDERLWVATIRDITAQHQMEQRLRLFERIVEDAPDGIALTSLAHPVVTYANTVFAHMCGVTQAEIVGTPISAYIAHVERDFPQVLREVTAHDRWHGVLTYRRKDGSTFPGLLSLFNTRDEQGNLDTTVGIVRDISAQEVAEEERIALQQQVIAAQQAALRELSTPLMPIADGLLVLPLIGAIDSRRAQDMTEVLLEGIVTRQAHTVIIDITGVSMVDTSVANALIRVAQAVQLLGSQVILTGIRPEVAQILVTLGVNLATIATQSTLQSGVAYALRQSADS